MTSIEFRDRSARAPGGDFRIFLGRSEKAAELRVLKARRELLQRLAARGEWDVLVALKDGITTIEEIERLVDQHGIRDYRAHLDLRAARAVSHPTLDEHVERWLGSVKKKGTRRMYALGLRKLRDHQVEREGVRVRAGDLPWPEVRPHHLRDLKMELDRSLAPATVQTYLAACSSFFDWAILREESQAGTDREPAMEVNPVRKAEVWETVQPTRHRFLVFEEYERLLEVSAPAMRPQYATLVCTGIRSSEFRNLPPNHIDVRSHLHVGPWGNWVPKGYPKSKRVVRDVPVHQTRLRPLLEEYKERWAGETTFFVNPRTGEKWSESAFRNQFYRDVEAAGLVAGTVSDEGAATPEGLTPHATRHSFASWLALADVQLMKIARLMGITETVCKEHYAHLLPSALEQSVQRLFSGGSVRRTDDFSTGIA